MSSKAASSIGGSQKPARRGVKLSPEDRARLIRLREEVTGRLHEMGLIVARTLKLEVTDEARFCFIPADVEAAHQGGGHGGKGGVMAMQFGGIKIVCTPSGCGCEDADAGMSYEC